MNRRVPMNPHSPVTVRVGKTGLVRIEARATPTATPTANSPSSLFP
jgi:hypothetical protein